MEKKINIAELLKDCPKGMELDCLLFKDAPVYFNRITNSFCYPIEIKVEHPDGSFEKFELSKEGCIYDRVIAKCVIFPKGKTTWEGFQRPFEDGDIVTCTNEYCTYIAIFKEMKDNNSFYRHAVIYNDEFCCVSNDWSDFNETCRIATEEEKQKLFDAIKANGYKWNDETKTLEKLIKPKFKVGDKIKKVNGCISGIITNIADDGSYKVEYQGGGISYISLAYQYEWELVPHIKSKFKVGDTIEKYGYKYTITEIKDNYYLTKCGNKIPIDYQDDFSLVLNKFDITNLKPFDKVLVRQSVHGIWGIDFFGFYNYDEGYYYTTSNCAYTQCIPYEGNEHLLGKTDDCDEYFKNWE